MKETRPPIPDPIKREVRQRCGFGCVICGNPIIQYDHMLGYAETKRHVASEITLLCIAHHGDKTAGRISKDYVIMHNAAPFNLKKELTSPYKLHLWGREINVIIGNNHFITRDYGSGAKLMALVAFGQPILEVIINNFDINLNIKLYDKLNNPVLIVENSEIMLATKVWDIEYTGSTLVIRQKSYNIFLLLKIDTNLPNKIYFRKAEFYYNGHFISIDNKTIYYDSEFLDNIEMRANTVLNYDSGLVIGYPLPKGTCVLHINI